MSRKLPIALGLFFVPVVTLAASINFGDYFLKGSQSVTDDVYAAGETVVFSGDVAGDALAAGRMVLSQGKISQDAFFAGETVRLQGAVGDDVRLLGGVVEIDGTITDDVFVVASRVVIRPSAIIGGSFFAVAEEVDFGGKILGDAKVLSNNLLFSGTVEGNVELWGKATFTEPARIEGDFLRHVRGKAQTPTAVTIGGKVISSDWNGGNFQFHRSFVGGLFSIKVLMLLMLGFLIFFLAKERAEEVLLDVLPNFWMRALRGFLIVLVLFATIPIFLVSVIGVPVALLFGALLLLLLLLSSAGAGVLLGAWCERVCFKRSPFPLSYRPVLFGIVLLSVISFIPVVGAVIHAILLLAVAGSLGTVFFRTLRMA